MLAVQLEPVMVDIMGRHIIIHTHIMAEDITMEDIRTGIMVVAEVITKEVAMVAGIMAGAAMLMVITVDQVFIFLKKKLKSVYLKDNLNVILFLYKNLIFCVFCFS
jgi:hypothetical protein